jgi:hypothetical protein
MQFSLRFATPVWKIFDMVRILTNHMEKIIEVFSVSFL